MIECRVLRSSPHGCARLIAFTLLTLGCAAGPTRRAVRTAPPAPAAAPSPSSELAGARANAVVPPPPAVTANEPEARSIAPVGAAPNAAPEPPHATPGAADPFAALRPVVGAGPLPPLSSLRPRATSEGDAATERVVVRVTTVPAGALVQHHGRTLGTTPLTFDLARPGTPLDLVLTRGGYMALRTRVERRESRSYVFELTPDKLH